MKIKTPHIEIWAELKAVFREAFTVLNIYIRKKETTQINGLNFHLKKPEKKEQI